MSFSEAPIERIPEIGIVADDLTGACDSGIEFVGRSHSVFVLVAPEPQEPVEAPARIIVRNTQTRNLPREKAYHRAFEATGWALSAGADIVFKKVDSALRGNFGIEIAAAMDATAARAAFILPAIPEAARETIGGVQHIHGIPIAETFYANDPEHPVRESSVLRRAEEGSGRKAGLITLDEVRAGQTAQAADTLQQKGYHLIVVDARSADDLNGAVRSLVQVAQAKLFVGCQGLAQALAAQLPALKDLPCSVAKVDSAILYVFGTLHPQSRRQLEVAAESGQVELVEVDSRRITDLANRDSVLDNLAKTCQAGLLAGRNLAICTSGEAPQAPVKLRHSVVASLSTLCQRVVQGARPGALVLTGGETAYSVCRALAIQGLKLHARIAPLVVASKVVGGPCHDMVVVTKGGSIGPDDLISRISESLHVAK